MYKEAVELDCCFAKALEKPNPNELSFLSKKTINAYRNAIDTNDNARDAIINLAFIEWLCTDPSTCGYLNLTVDELAHLEKDSLGLLEHAIVRFPDDPEPPFWKRFFRYFSYGESLPENEAIRLLHSYKEGVLPFILMLGLLDIIKYGKFGKDLLPTLLKEKTAKNCYIANYYYLYQIRGGGVE